MGLISVIIPTFNAEAFIGAAIDSVIAQGYPAVEIIVVDDGSTDDTAALTRRKLAADFGGRWEVIETGRNRGPSAARNAGLRVAQGEWVQYLDGDDLLLGDKFSRQMAAAAAAPDDVVMVYSPWRRGVAADGGIEWREPLARPDVDHRAPVMCLAPTCRPLLAASLIRRSVLVAIGGLDESLRFWECEEVVVRVAQHGRLLHVPTPGPSYFWRLSQTGSYVGNETARYRFGPVGVGWLEQVMRATDGRTLRELALPVADEKLLHDECANLARLVFRYDRAWFKHYMAVLRVFHPRFRPVSPFYVAVPSRVVPYEAVETLVSAARSFLHEFRRRMLRRASGGAIF